MLGVYRLSLIILLSNYAVQGYDLSAVFMRNWDTRDESGSDDGCEWKKDWEDVQRVCRMLDLPVKMVRFVLLMTMSLASSESRSILAGNIGSGYLNHPYATGLQDCHRIPTSGATGENGLSYVVSFLYILITTGKLNSVPSWTILRRSLPSQMRGLQLVHALSKSCCPTFLTVP